MTDQFLSSDERRIVELEAALRDSEAEGKQLRLGLWAVIVDSGEDISDYSAEGDPLPRDEALVKWSMEAVQQGIRDLKEEYDRAEKAETEVKQLREALIVAACDLDKAVGFSAEAESARRALSSGGGDESALGSDSRLKGKTA